MQKKKEKKQPPLNSDISKYVAMAIKRRDKDIVDFYKKFRLDDINKYMSDEIFVSQKIFCSFRLTKEDISIRGYKRTISFESDSFTTRA